MKIRIAPKLFMGFLVIIFLNASFVLVVSKLSDLNIISTILKRQNDIKNYLIQVENLHVSRTRSRFIYEKLGKDESVENFIERGREAEALIDTIQLSLRRIFQLDSTVYGREYSTTGSAENRDLAGLITTVENELRRNNSIYSNTFEDLVKYRKNQGKDTSASRTKLMNEVLDSADVKINTGLATTDSLVDIQTRACIKQVESYIDNVRKLTLVIVTGVSVFSLLFGLIFSRMTTNSLRRLIESTKTIAKGEFDFNPKGYPNDEIGELATAFFDMAHDLKKAQSELVKSKRLAAIGEIVASVNHEINNPLMIISGNAQFLEMSMDGYPQEMKDRVRAILEETERISHVTRKLRDIKKPVVEDYTSSGEQMINLDKSSV